jgi:hypothetical protein
LPLSLLAIDGTRIYEFDKMMLFHANPTVDDKEQLLMFVKRRLNDGAAENANTAH